MDRAGTSFRSRSSDRPLRTGSLRRRVVLSTLALSLVIIVALGAVVNLVLGDRLRSDLRQRLVERAHYGSVLATRGVTGQQLADELTGQGIAVSVVSGSNTYLGRELAPITTSEPPSAESTTVTRTVVAQPSARATAAARSARTTAHPARPTAKTPSSTAIAVLRRVTLVEASTTTDPDAPSDTASSDFSSTDPSSTSTPEHSFGADAGSSSASAGSPGRNRHQPGSGARRHNWFQLRIGAAHTPDAAATSADAARTAATTSAPAPSHPAASPTPAAPAKTPASAPPATGRDQPPASAPRTTPSMPVRLTRSGSQLSAQIVYGTTTVRLTASEAEIDRTLSTLRTIEIIVGALILALAGGLSISVVSGALSPLRRMTKLAEQIRSGDRGRRLRAERVETDLGRMAVSFDQMLDALESAELEAQASENRMRQFLADASHDLRTPLAVMLAEAEQLLRSDPGRAQREQQLVALIREGHRAARMVDDLVLMARLDDPDPSAALLDNDFDLRELVNAMTTRMRLTLSDRQLNVTLPAEPIAAHGDPDRLTRALTNLIENARNATHSGGRIDVRLIMQTGVAVIDVIDDGPGIAPDEAERVFDRFVRLDTARRGTGSGLGLPIARAVARGHGGDLRYVINPGGAHFRLTMPIMSRATPTSTGSTPSPLWRTSSH